MTIIFSELGRKGRLGNQLWQIAASIGVAEAAGEDVRFPHWEYAPFFSVPPEYFVDPLELQGTEAHAGLVHMLPGHRVYMQDYLLIARLQDRIRAYFQPSELAMRELAPYGWPTSVGDTVALHVRRGDLVNQENFPPIVSLKYYQRASALYPDGPITVFSDDMAWCRENLPGVLPGRHLSFCEAGGSKPPMDWIDLQLMARHSRYVISNSTYAWWGAFLSGSDSVVYPSEWHGPPPTGPDAHLMFPSTWTEVANSAKDLDARARSNAYLRCFYRMPQRRVAQWPIGPLRVAQALLADPSNTLRSLGDKASYRVGRLIGRERRRGGRR